MSLEQHRRRQQPRHERRQASTSCAPSLEGGLLAPNETASITWPTTSECQLLLAGYPDARGMVDMHLVLPANPAQGMISWNAVGFPAGRLEVRVEQAAWMIQGVQAQIVEVPSGYPISVTPFDRSTAFSVAAASSPESTATTNKASSLSSTTLILVAVIPAVFAIVIVLAICITYQRRKRQSQSAAFKGTLERRMSSSSKLSASGSGSSMLMTQRPNEKDNPFGDAYARYLATGPQPRSTSPASFDTDSTLHPPDAAHKARKPSDASSLIQLDGFEAAEIVRRGSLAFEATLAQVKEQEATFAAAALREKQEEEERRRRETALNPDDALQRYAEEVRQRAMCRFSTDGTAAAPSPTTGGGLRGLLRNKSSNPLLVAGTGEDTTPRASPDSGAAKRKPRKLVRKNAKQLLPVSTPSPSSSRSVTPNNQPALVNAFAEEESETGIALSIDEPALPGRAMTTSSAWPIPPRTARKADQETEVAWREPARPESPELVRKGGLVDPKPLQQGTAFAKPSQRAAPLQISNSGGKKTGQGPSIHSMAALVHSGSVPPSPAPTASTYTTGTIARLAPPAPLRLQPKGRPSDDPFLDTESDADDESVYDDDVSFNMYAGASPPSPMLMDPDFPGTPTAGSSTVAGGGTRGSTRSEESGNSIIVFGQAA